MLSKNHPVADKYKEWTYDLIRKDVQNNTFPYAVLMQNLSYDINIGAFIRNGNAFGAEKIFYVQDKKKFNPTGAVGSHHYKEIKYIKYLEGLNEVKELKEEYYFVMFDTGIGAIPLDRYCWHDMDKRNRKPLLVFGCEGTGLTEDMLQLADVKLEIKMFGSVRSLNTAVAAGIAMNSVATYFNGLMKYER
jgi:tRNA G18 (ribose-2'-O)-methylase SpoU